jgi:hypothetical protein
MNQGFRITITIVSIVSLFLVYDALFAVSGYITTPILGFITATTAPTTANVTIQGTVGSITVYYYPVNFSTVNPGNACNPKVQAGGVGYIIVEVNSSTNVNYNLYFKGTNIVAGSWTIPVGNVHFGNTSGLCPNGDTDLSTSYVTNATAFTNKPYTSRNTTIYFWIDTSVGWYNDTYNGNLTILVNGTDAINNETWFGQNNITLTIDKYIDISWDLVPINFTSLIPGQKSNATANQGNPANLSVNANTNIFVDGYVNGSNLNCVGGGCGTDFIGMTNLTFTNVSTYAGPFNTLSSSWQNFNNWNNSGNTSDLLNYWNISIPSAQLPGNYGGNITGKAVDKGTAP